MSRRRSTIDEKPGPVPDIHSDGDNLTFILPLNEVEEGLRLVLRCDGDGNVWASIAPVEKSSW